MTPTQRKATVTDEENEQFSQDVSTFKGADPEATKHALEQFLKRREALAEPAPEPVAYVDKDGFIVEIDEVLIAPGDKLYAAPVREPAPEPVGCLITDCDGALNLMDSSEFYRCRECGGVFSADAVNRSAALVEPAPVPVPLNADGCPEVQATKEVMDKMATAAGIPPYSHIQRLIATKAGRVREPAPVPLLTHGEVWAIWNGEIGVDEMNQKDAFRFAGLIEALVRQKAGL